MLGAVLLGTMVGVVWARPQGSPQAADITRKVTVPAAFFHPREEGLNWSNDGGGMAVDSGSAIFTAPVVFPTLSAVTVKKITLSVEDHNGTVDACVTLYRTSPKNLTQVSMATACSSGTWGGRSTLMMTAYSTPRSGPPMVPTSGWTSLGRVSSYTASP